MIYQMCINNFKTKHQCLIFGHSAFTFSKMISWKLSCAVWLCELKYICKHTHMCARSPIRLIRGMAQAPIRAYLPRDASTAAYLPMRAATADSIRVLIGKAPSIIQFFKNFLCWNIVERLQWAMSKKRVLWCSKKVLSKMLLYCNSSWFLILIKYRSMGLTAQGLSEWRWESLF